ncbi:MAG: DUF5074 domain-containing protein [Ignavibacteriaceae bacterium]
MKIFVLLLILLINIILLPQQLSKVYVLGEGGFAPGTAKLSLLDKISNNYMENIFSPVSLGLFPDGFALYNNYLYVVEQGNFGGSGKIYKVDTNGTVLQSSTFGTNPYSLAIANNKIYVTNGPGGYVSVLNLSDFSEIKTIQVGVYPQEILAYGNYVYVANTSLYGGASDSTVSVISTSTDAVIHTITLKKDPSSLVVSNDNHLLVACPGDAANGKIFKINPLTFSVVAAYSVPSYGIDKDISVDNSGNNLYFISSLNSIVKFNPDNSTAEEIVPSTFMTNYYYGYKFEPVTRKHYVLDAKSFLVSGSLNIHSENGTLENSYTTSQIPRRVLFKYTDATSGVREEKLPETFTLSQNYPNPFNPATNINFEIAHNSFVTLKVFDIMGNEIASLISSEYAPGEYQVTFNPANLPSGIYFYTLTAGDFTNTKKMQLIK